MIWVSHTQVSLGNKDENISQGLKYSLIQIFMPDIDIVDTT